MACKTLVLSMYLLETNIINNEEDCFPFNNRFNKYNNLLYITIVKSLPER